MKKIILVIGWMGINLTSALGQTNVSPVAAAGADQVLMDTDENNEETFMLDGSGSNDSDGTIVSYEWTDESGTVLGTSATLTTTLPIGSEEIKLTVTDNEGATGVDYVALFVGHPTNYGNNRISIRGGSQDIFANGINLAWDDYSLDIVEFDEEYFTSVFEKLSAYGGNSLRWWLHTNGRHSPQFDDQGMVKKIAPNDIRNMRKALDMAHDYGVVISMCLFSFDLLQNQGQNHEHTRKLLEDETVRQSYMDNALVPIMKEIGDHPAVMTWEIFNEPEGMTTQFGWSDEKTTMTYIQEFVNLAASTIHDHTSEALVSNGSWSVKASTDVEDFFNYYRDDRLVAAGGKANGTLDFYQIHYYPEHFASNYSPFHRPASYWDLDKPIVIGEFPVAGVDGKADPHLTTTASYQLAMDYGYAGVLAWSYSGFGGGDIETAKEGLEQLAADHASDILIGDDPNFNEAPVVNGDIPSLRGFSGNGLEYADHFDLNDIFSDPEGQTLTYALYDISNDDFTEVGLQDGMLSVFPYDGVKGNATVIISGTDPQGASEWATLTISLGEDTGNLAKFKSIEASSFEGSAENRTAEMANDGDQTTRWSSVYEDNHWISVDLGSVMEFNQVKILWEDAFAQSYTVEVSEDQTNWSEVHAESNGDGAWDDIQLDDQSARYVRVNGQERATQWGFSIWELEVYHNVTLDVRPQQPTVVFPNPVKNHMTISSSQTVRSIQLTDLQGRSMEGWTFNANNQLDLSTLKAGIYVLSLGTSAGKETFRIIKQN